MDADTLAIIMRALQEAIDWYDAREERIRLEMKIIALSLEVTLLRGWRDYFLKQGFSRAQAFEMAKAILTRNLPDSFTLLFGGGYLEINLEEEVEVAEIRPETEVEVQEGSRLITFMEFREGDGQGPITFTVQTAV